MAGQGKWGGSSGCSLLLCAPVGFVWPNAILRRAPVGFVWPNVILRCALVRFVWPSGCVVHVQTLFLLWFCRWLRLRKLASFAENVKNGCATELTGRQVGGAARLCLLPR